MSSFPTIPLAPGTDLLDRTLWNGFLLEARRRKLAALEAEIRAASTPAASYEFPLLQAGLDPFHAHTLTTIRELLDWDTIAAGELHNSNWSNTTGGLWQHRWADLSGLTVGVDDPWPNGGLNLYAPGGVATAALLARMNAALTGAGLPTLPSSPLDRGDTPFGALGIPWTRKFISGGTLTTAYGYPQAGDLVGPHLFHDWWAYLVAHDALLVGCGEDYLAFHQVGGGNDASEDGCEAARTAQAASYTVGAPIDLGTPAGGSYMPLVGTWTYGNTLATIRAYEDGVRYGWAGGGHLWTPRLGLPERITSPASTLTWFWISKALVPSPFLPWTYENILGVPCGQDQVAEIATEAWPPAASGYHTGPLIGTTDNPVTTSAVATCPAPGTSYDYGQGFLARLAITFDFA